PFTWTRFSKAPSPPICRCSSRRASSSPSTARPPRRWGSRSRWSCLSWLTRSSNRRRSMHRRSFLTLLGASTAAWPLAARAQQDGRVRRVAILLAYPPTDAEWQARVRALREELAKLGWIAGRNIQFDVRWTTDNMDLVRANVANVVELNPDVIVTSGG